MIALPVQGAAAAVMMVCGAAQALPGVSMQDRHVAMKARGEAQLGGDAASLPPTDAAHTTHAMHVMHGASAFHGDTFAHMGMVVGTLSADAVADYVAAAATADWVAEADDPATEATVGMAAYAASGTTIMATAALSPHDRDHHDTNDSHGGHQRHAVCGACAACPGGAMIASGLPPFLLGHHGYAAPQTAFSAVADFITSPALRPPAHC
jgi:hypothetical protein